MEKTSTLLKDHGSNPRVIMHWPNNRMTKYNTFIYRTDAISFKLHTFDYNCNVCFYYVAAIYKLFTHKIMATAEKMTQVKISLVAKEYFLLILAFLCVQTFFFHQLWFLLIHRKVLQSFLKCITLPYLSRLKRVFHCRFL